MTIARGVVAAVIFFAHLAPHLGRRAVRGFSCGCTGLPEHPRSRRFGAQPGPPVREVEVSDVEGEDRRRRGPRSRTASAAASSPGCATPGPVGSSRRRASPRSSASQPGGPTTLTTTWPGE